MAVKKSGKKNNVVEEVQAPYKVSRPATAVFKKKHISTQSIISSYKAAYNSSALDVIALIRDGVSPNEFAALQKSLPFNLSEWATYLQVSERTLQRNQKENKAFPAVQSEKIMELSLLYEFGTQVFGNEENFVSWLNAKSPALGGKRPKDLLDTQLGILTIKDELGRIQHGILA